MGQHFHSISFDALPIVHHQSLSKTLLTPLYNKAILVTEKHPAEIFFFGRFLVRLSESDHSQVLSMASFFCAHSN